MLYFVGDANTDVKCEQALIGIIYSQADAFETSFFVGELFYGIILNIFYEDFYYSVSDGHL